jgi:hypothetical protein
LLNPAHFSKAVLVVVFFVDDRATEHADGAPGVEFTSDSDVVPAGVRLNVPTEAKT